MASFHASATQTGTKTASRGPTITAGTKDVQITEIGYESTTAVSSQVAVRRTTATSATGETALTEIIGEDDGQAPTASVTHGMSADNTMTTGNIRTSHLPAAIGGGPVWTFDPPLRIRGGSGDGVCLTLPGGSDAVINFHFSWIE